MLVAVALAAAGVAWQTLATIRSLDDAALQSQARLVAGRVGTGADGRPTIRNPEELRAAFAAADDGGMFFVGDEAGAVLLASDPAAAAAAIPYAPASGFFRVPPSAAFPTGFLGVATASGRWRVVVAQQHDQQEALVASLSERFMATALWLLLPLVVATVAVGVLTIRAGLRPLRVTSEAARRVGPGAPGVRLPAEGLPREMVPLVAATNDALERLERALDAQRRFAGDAAHALRTPLAVLAARVESLCESPAGHAPALAPLREDADRLSRLVGQMLMISRLDGLPPDVSGRLDLSVVAAEVISALAPLAGRRGVDLALNGGEGGMPARGDAASVELALQNLVHNAIFHAPPGSEVEVALEAPATPRVLDRGPGVPEAARRDIFRRFHTARPGGAGLGLAIVAGVAAAHGGAAWVEARAGGGAVFVLRPGDV
jgi:signal transduction histidine kinase